MAPLVDVMFILVIFFLISTSYDFQEGFEVDLPVSDAPLVAGHKMVVVIAKGSEEGGKYLVFFNNEMVSWDELEVKLAQRIEERSMPSSSDGGRKSRRPTVSLKADKTVPYEYVLKVLSLANRMKVKVNQVVSPPGQ